MRKIVLILLLASISNLGLGQNYSFIYAGENMPVRYSAAKPERKLGFEFGYSRGYKLRENLFLEGGVAMDFWGEINKVTVYYINIFNNNTVYFKGMKATESFAKFSVEFPFLVNYKIGRFGIKNGVSLYARNLFWITTSTETEYHPENEVVSPRFTNKDPYRDDVIRNFGVAYHVALSYSLTEKWDLYADYKTPVISYDADPYESNGKIYGLLNFGVAYRFTGK